MSGHLKENGVWDNVPTCPECGSTDWRESIIANGYACRACFTLLDTRPTSPVRTNP